MTDDITSLGPDFNADALLAKNERVFAKLSESVRSENKAKLFDALAQAKITSVEVTFDGFGDSGQIEDVTAKAGDKEVALLFHEIISWKLRMFVPTDAAGIDVLRNVLDHYPVARVAERAT